MKTVNFNRRVAVLDLGTNVFNLVIANFNPDSYSFVKEYKHAARLGAGGGIKSGMILPQAFDSASIALGKIMDVIKETGDVSLVHPYATSAVRDAVNSLEFVESMNERFGVAIDVISGDREAELIFKGIKSSGVFNSLKSGETALLMDIGGGSNEFIITDGANVLYKRSFPLGMARMRQRFNYEEPIPDSVITEFKNFCYKEMTELWDNVEKFSPVLLIGSSGSFDTFKDYIFNCGFREFPAIELPLEKLYSMNEDMLKSTYQERMLMPGMSPIRVDFIVLSSLFTQLVIDRIKPNKVFQSSYSLKEGGIAELYEEWKAGRLCLD